MVEARGFEPATTGRAALPKGCSITGYRFFTVLRNCSSGKANPDLLLNHGFRKQERQTMGTMNTPATSAY
jgi:hypothetical protein